MAFLAGFTSMILWIHDNHGDNISAEQNIESGQKDPLSVKDISYENLSRKQIELRIDELQTLI